MDAECTRYFQRITQCKRHAFKHSLRHIRSCRIHRHTDKGRTCIRVIVRRTLTHQIRKEIYMVLTKLFNLLLLCCVILRADDLVHPPFIAGCRAQHTAHKVIMPVRMGKRMQCIKFVHAKLLGRNKNRAARAKRNIAASISDGAGADRRSCIISGSRYDLDIGRYAKLCSHFRQKRTYCLIALVNLRHHLFFDAADVKHFLRPTAIFYIKQQHTGCIRYICTVYAGQTICQIVLRQHNLRDPCKILRLIFLYPQNLRSRKAGKCNVCSIFGKCLFSNHLVQVRGLLCRPAIIPEDRRANHLILVIQNNQSMHLSSKADTCQLALIGICKQLLQPINGHRIPVFRLLL